jgi:glycosyltransferase involved in cell wall biosynthesis
MSTVTVSIPCWRSPRTIRRAVDAVLAQDHTDLTLIVVNDGDTQTPPWPALADLDDPRLVRFDLGENRGRYFCDAVTLAACTTPWWMPHDADDAADPAWISTLLDAATTQHAKAAFCGTQVHADPNLPKVPPPTEPGPERPAMEPAFRHGFHMAGLWNTQFLRQLGGPHPNFRVAFDSMMTGMAVASGPTVVLKDKLYHRYPQPDSLTRSAETTFGSRIRGEARNWIIEHSHTVAALGKKGPAHVGEFMRSTHPAHLTAAVTAHADRLKELL